MRRARGVNLPYRRYNNSSDTEFRLRLPKRQKGEMFAIADKLHGASHITAVCEDGKARMGRIPGKLRKRMWIREGDLLIVKPWEFQDEKADITWRYTQTQAHHLQKRGKLPDELEKF